MELDQLVEPDRVHRRCYTDPEIFEHEMHNIFERIWVYCGPESQVLRLIPPLTISDGELEQALAILTRALSVPLAA